MTNENGQAKELASVAFGEKRVCSSQDEMR